VPFLDHELVEYALTIPYYWKLNMYNLQTKDILKRIAIERLPRNIIYRKKSGFGVPLFKWFREDYGLKVYLNLLTKDTLKKKDIFDTDRIKLLVGEHESGQRDHSDILWPLINLALWFQFFIDDNYNDNDVKMYTKDILHM
jgi:asparagine synthase (glutamine-hydrolysing)